LVLSRDLCFVVPFNDGFFFDFYLRNIYTGYEFEFTKNVIKCYFGIFYTENGFRYRANI